MLTLTIVRVITALDNLKLRLGGFQTRPDLRRAHNKLSQSITLVHYPFPFFGRTLADNHLRGCYGVTGGVGRARKLAMRRAPGLDDIGGEVGDVDPRVPPARTRTSARFDVNLTL
ncbi:jg13896 [Pararge aegeria aegeria]|uniref:Jg13896 protein n=1 Tax=Pararge aegeria aegeria TaxID=348720 RepID=A0A8S4SH48_9NEOP|nr:jg13896 [Pararge aegeria aegeria]